jgi:uncharacterized Zn finger protein
LHTGGDERTSRETADEKARRYLVEGRLTLVRVTPNTAAAVVRGGGAVHHVNASPDGWSCTCPARGRCSHQLALGLVVALDRQEPQR